KCPKKPRCPGSAQNLVFRAVKILNEASGEPELKYNGDDTEVLFEIFKYHMENKPKIPASRVQEFNEIIGQLQAELKKESDRCHKEWKEKWIGRAETAAAI
ncbi:hypothetical protein FRC02_006911, partial [Tulasnella sp. 418]